MIDSDLHARLAARDSTAWTALRAWLESGPDDRRTTKTLEEIAAVVGDWPAAIRTATPDDWARLEAGGQPPAWWPLVLAVTIDGLTSLDPIDALRSVESIRFDQRAETASLAILAELPMLREVVMGGLGPDTLSSLPPLPNLTRLSAIADRLPDDFAEQFPSLGSLSLSNSSELTRLPRLPNGLIDLDLSGCEQLERLDELDGCPALRALDLRRCDALPDYAALSRVPMLERVRIDARKSRPLEPVAACGALRELWIASGGSPIDVRPLDRHSALQALGLEGCAAVGGLDGLALPALEELHVLHCGVTGLPDLRASGRLRILDLEGLAAVRSLPPVQEGHVLELVRLIDMTGLAEAPAPAAHRIVDGRSR